jgi:mannose-6-phosphate isomerase-like protein (cupin superfamily)
MKPFVSNTDELPQDRLEWGTLQWLCNASVSPGAKQTLGICHIFAGQSNPLHYHPNCEELLYVLSGQGRHSYDGQMLEVRPGSTIRVPANVRHNVENTGSETLVCLVAFSSGERETVFVED